MIKQWTKQFLFGLLALTLLPLAAAANTQNSDNLLNNPQVQKFIKRTAKKYKMSEAYVREVMSKAKINHRVVKSIKHPAEKRLTWYRYRAIFIKPQRIQDGVEFWKQHAKVLQQAQQKFGVPASVIVGILGVETKFGREMGNYSILNALTTLAFGYPERGKFFQKELGEYIYLAKNTGHDPAKLLGSYAGAMGMCQFMPSSYLHYAVAYKGKGTPNLFDNPNDAIFSIANYLKKNGWVRGAPITSPAIVSGPYFRNVLKLDTKKIQDPTRSLKQFAKLDVIPAGSYNQKTKAYLMGLETQEGVNYWLAFHNFYVITRYNTSDFYAMAVYQLGEQIEAAYQKQKK